MVVVVGKVITGKCIAAGWFRLCRVPKTRATQQRAPMPRPERALFWHSAKVTGSANAPKGTRKNGLLGNVGRHVAPDDRTHGVVTEDFFAECHSWQRCRWNFFRSPSFSSPSAPLGKEGPGKALGEAFVDSPDKKHSAKNRRRGKFCRVAAAECRTRRSLRRGGFGPSPSFLTTRRRFIFQERVLEKQILGKKELMEYAQT